MVERFVRSGDQADIYDLLLVTVDGLLTNLQHDRGGLQREFALAREATTQAFRGKGAARMCEADVLMSRDNA